MPTSFKARADKLGWPWLKGSCWMTTVSSPRSSSVWRGLAKSSSPTASPAISGKISPQAGNPSVCSKSVRWNLQVLNDLQRMTVTVWCKMKQHYRFLTRTAWFYLFESKEVCGDLEKRNNFWQPDGSWGERIVRFTYSTRNTKARLTWVLSHGLSRPGRAVSPGLPWKEGEYVFLSSRNTKGRLTWVVVKGLSRP